MNGTDDMGLWPLLATVKSNNMVMAHLLINHSAHIHQQNCKRLELHTLAETQKGPYPDVWAYLLLIQAVPECTCTTAHTMSNSCWQLLSVSVSSPT
jgi:hypothetical protein